MVCDDVRRVAYFFLDGTLGQSKRVEMQQHLEDCDDCDTRVRFHDQLRKFVKKRLPKVSAPGSLRERVSSTLQGVRATG